MEKVLATVNIKDISPVTFTAFSSFGDLAYTVVRNAFVLAGIISFILIVVGGFGVIIGAGGGDSKRIEQGKQTITYAVIGLLLVVTSYWIVQIITRITGINQLNIGVK